MSIEYHLVDAEGNEWHGFKSRLAAWKYVPQCEVCQAELDMGYIERIGSDGYTRYRIDRSHPYSTACACEYLVLSDREYKDYHDPPYECWEQKDRVMSRYWAKRKRSRRPRR